MDKFVVGITMEGKVEVFHVDADQVDEVKARLTQAREFSGQQEAATYRYKNDLINTSEREARAASHPELKRLR